MKGRLSLATVFVLCAAVVAVRWMYPQRQVLTWDVFGYYLYLPATVIHDDIALRDPVWLEEAMATYAPSATLYQVVDGPDGARVIRYGSGMALLYAPWFCLAHVISGPLGLPADGFSMPYQVSMAVGCLLFSLAGLFVLRQVLLPFFNDRWTATLLLLIALGTNWFQLTAWDGTLLTHSALFTLYGLLLLVTIRWHDKPSWQAAFGIGAAVGLITLVRPSELVAALIPLLWGLGPADARKAKWQAIRTHGAHILLAALAFVVATAPQLLYWHATTGQWLFYSYMNPGEGFDLATPHLRPFLISFRKGWFVYTPMMILAIGGIIMLRKRIPQAFWAVFLFLLVDLWIVSSWSCWWYAGGSFSARAMVPAYVVMALPLGAFLQWTWSQQLWRYAVRFVCGAFVILNLFQTWQWTVGIISKERMTKAYYRAVFGRTQVPHGADSLLLVQRPLGAEERLVDERRYTVREVFRANYDDQADSVLTLHAGSPFSPAFETTFEGLTGKDHAWLRASVRYWVGDTATAPPSLVIHFEHDGGVYKYMARDVVVPADTRQTWVSFTMDYITPEVRSRHDRVKAYVWNQRGTRMRVDDFVVQVFEPK